MATITSNVVTGNWSATGSWSGAVVPGAGDLAIIANGAIITVDVDTTIGATTSVGIGITINGASSGSFGTLRVSSGVTLTLRGFDATTHCMMQINQYGLFSPQPGSIIRGDVAADFGSCIINKGRFEAIGSSGSHITFSVPQDSTHVNWGSVSDTNSKALSEAKTPSGYEAGLNLAIIALGNPLISNAAKTGLGSMGDSSLTINSSTPSLTTEVALGTYPTPGSNVTSAGKYAIDYETGFIYLYTTTYAGLASNSTYWHLDKVTADWRGWGIVSWGATTGNTCLIDYCDFQYMGCSTATGKTVNSVISNAPVVLQGHIGGDSTRLAYVKRSTFKYGYKSVQLANCTGTSGDPILISGNTFGDCSGAATVDGISCYTSTATYVSIDGNTINTRGNFIDVNNIGSDIPNWSVTNNTGVVGQCFWNATAIGGPITPFARRSTSDALQSSSPDLYIAGNSVAGSGLAEINSNGRFLNVSGTSGHPCIVENNWFHHCVRFGHFVGSYVTHQKNRYGMAYHHGFTGSNLDDTYVTDITFQNNLFYCDRGSTGSASTSPAIQCGYNHRVVINNLKIVNNTFDGWLYGALDYGDIVDASANTTATNLVIVNNIIANGKYAFGRYASSTQVDNLHVIESDYNVIYNQATGYAGGATGGLTGTVPTGFYQGVFKYNRQTGVDRNINGVALFDPSYSTDQTSRSLVYTVTTLGTNHTLGWGGGTAVQLIIDSGTSAGGGLRTIGCSGKSWTLQQASLIQQWLWVVSGTGSGQARVITRVTANTAVGATVSAGGTGYSVGQIIQNQSQTTFDLTGTTGYYPTFKVTSVSAGAVTAVSIISGGTITTTGSNPVSTTRITGTSGGGCTLTLTYAPGLLLVPDLATAVDNTSVFAIVSAYVQLTDSGSGTVHAGLYLPDPSDWQNAIQLPTSTAVDSVSVMVTNSPTGSPGYSAAAASPTATDYQWTSGSAKDAATSDNVPSTDYFGTSRPQGTVSDIGFFELLQATGGVRRRRIITGGE